MGADLYINKDGSEDTGYFRDSYNDSNILWKLGLSYWQLEKQIPDLGKVKSALTVKQTKILYLEIINREPKLQSFLNTLDEAWLKEHHCTTGVEEWKKFWTKKYADLKKFLEHAIELKSAIRWSV